MPYDIREDIQDTHGYLEYLREYRKAYRGVKYHWSVKLTQKDGAPKPPTYRRLQLLILR